MRVTNLDVRGESRVELSSTCSLVGSLTRLTKPDGSEEVYDVRDVHMFLGVPYAQPPVGDLMFRDPEPLELWEGERLTKEFGPACPQSVDWLAHAPIIYEPPGRQSVDCLYLNIWTPNTSPEARLPVMVWFYGGGFQIGYTDMYRGDVLPNFHDVVLVTVGYRLAVWGFLCTGDSAATGNYGLFDQLEALKWVNKYIANFGGDPNNVTIFGESAGAASVACHMVSPLSRGLFKNAISQSGTLLVLGEIRKPAELVPPLRAYLKTIGCEATKGEDIVSFLRSQPAEKLILPMAMQNMFFLPVIDGRFITAKATELLSTGTLNKANYLMGVTRDEGALMSQFFLQMLNIDSSSLNQQVAGQLLAGIVSQGFLGQCDVGKVLGAITEEYLSGINDGEGIMRALTEMIGDMMFVANALRTADAHSGVSPVYFYSFEMRNAFVKFPEYIRADHAAEVPSVFGLPYLYPDIKFSSQDRKLCRQLMAYWTNFAKTGNPNGQGLEAWPEYRIDEGKYLVLDETVRPSEKLKNQRVKFWNETLPKLIQ